MSTTDDTVLCPACARPNRPSAPRCSSCGELMPGGAGAADTPPFAADASEPGSADVTASALSRHASTLLELGDLEATIPLYRRMLQSDPDSTVAFDQLEALYRTGARWTELAELYAHVASCTAVPARKPGLHERAAVLAEERLADQALAIHHYERLRALAPDHPTAFGALARLYQAVGDEAKLAALRGARG
jgi:tetratricopeptide (TPR) repeat protein